MTTQRTATALLLTASLITLAACGRSDETLGQKVDGAVSQTKEAAQQASSQAAASVEKTLEKTSEVMKQDSAKATNVLDDAAITTSINAGLAKDPDLSALKIDVDTKAGKVSLHGSAPSTQARDRAVTIAQSVKGVISVDNQLTIKEKT
jgi:hyperosmotically inducible periplasmic protein